MTQTEIAEMERLWKVAAPQEEFAEPPKLTLDGYCKEDSSYWVGYNDGDLCAAFHSNMGLGCYGEDYARFFVAAYEFVPAVIEHVGKLQERIDARDAVIRELVEWLEFIWRENPDFVAAPDAPVLIAARKMLEE